VYFVVTAFVLRAFFRRPPGPDAAEPVRPTAAQEQRLGRWVWGGTIATAAILFALLVAEGVAGCPSSGR